MTFTGAASGSYDGSNSLEIEIPQGGGSEKEWVCLMNTTFTEDTQTFEVTKDINGNDFSVDELFMKIYLVKPAGGGSLQVIYGSSGFVASSFFADKAQAYGTVNIYKKANMWIMETTNSHATSLGGVVRPYGTISVENAPTITNFKITTTSGNSFFAVGSIVEIWGLKA